MASPAGRLCRICLSDDELQVSLYSAYARKHKILVKIRVCLPISIDPDDTHPKTICHSCISRLDQYYDYYCNSLTTQRVLQEGESSYREFFKRKVDRKLTAAVERHERQHSATRVVPAGSVNNRSVTGSSTSGEDKQQKEMMELLTQSPQVTNFSSSTFVVGPIRSPAPKPSTSFLDLKKSYKKKRKEAGTSTRLFGTYDARLPRVSPTLFNE